MGDEGHEQRNGEGNQHLHALAHGQGQAWPGDHRTEIGRVTRGVGTNVMSTLDPGFGAAGDRGAGP